MQDDDVNYESELVPYDDEWAVQVGRQIEGTSRAMIVDGLGSGLFAVCVSNYDKNRTLSVSEGKTLQSESMKVQKFQIIV